MSTRTLSGLGRTLEIVGGHQVLIARNRSHPREAVDVDACTAGSKVRLGARPSAGACCIEGVEPNRCIGLRQSRQPGAAPAVCDVRPRSGCCLRMLAHEFGQIGRRSHRRSAIGSDSARMDSAALGAARAARTCGPRARCSWPPGRMILPSMRCSMTCAAQPEVREITNSGVNIAVGHAHHVVATRR